MMQPSVVYSARSRPGSGRQTWAEMAREIWSSRELTWQLFLRDFSVRYRQSVFGYVWAIIPPLVTAATFTWLARSRVLPVAGTRLPYPVFLLLNMTVWQLFAGGLTGATQSLAGAGSLITKINFPRETLVLAAFGQSLFEFVVRVALVAIAFAVYAVKPAWTVALIPLLLLPLCLFTLGLGFVLSLANGVLRDVGQMVGVLLVFWMFLTPVVYPAPVHSAAARINVLNPVSPFLIAGQDFAERGRLSRPEGYAGACAISLVVFLLGWRVFHVAEPRIAERV